MIKLTPVLTRLLLNTFYGKMNFIDVDKSAHNMKDITTHKEQRGHTK